MLLQREEAQFYIRDESLFMRNSLSEYYFTVLGIYEYIIVIIHR